MAYPNILFHGATRGVTGSCHELCIDSENSILIDCGITQGDDLKDLTIDFSVEHIRALIVTHVHIDHIGRIPYLLVAGFDGPIYCSEASAVLLPLMLEDAVKIGFTRDRQLIDRFITKIKKMVVPVPYKSWVRIGLTSSDLSIKLQPAGHILGSAYVECDLHGQRYVFSGDLGAPYAPLLPAPRSPFRGDVLVLESTYGDRNHEGRRERRERLKEMVEKALLDLGVILIPAFSIGRTQELLYELEELIHHYGTRQIRPDLRWQDLEIIVDSPLAAAFNTAYRELCKYWDAEGLNKISRGRHPLSFEQITTIASHQEHLQTLQYLKKKARPCIVIAGSGMCSGGRIINYLKELLNDVRTDVLFVGYQAAGTPGRAIQTYGPDGGYVVLDGQRYIIKAGVHTIHGYSAHADKQNLINFVKRMRRKPKMIYLVHGEQGAKDALKVELEKLDSDLKVVIPG